MGGKISRFLANKCALAARLDQHLINPTNRFGLAMKKQVEDRLTALASGEKTDRNLDVMEEVLQELKEENLYVESTIKQKKKKKSKKSAKDKKKKKKSSMAEEELEVQEDAMEEEEP